MHLFRSVPALIFFFLVLVPNAWADSPRGPLQLLPEQADIVINIERPRQLADVITGLDVFKQLQTLAPVREFYDAGNFRRFFEIVYHFERELGADKYELLDRLAGQGAVLGVKFLPPGFVLLAIQGKDEALLQKFKATALRVVEAELARLDVKGAIQKGTHRNVEVVRIGKDLFAATVGTTLLVSNTGEGLQAGLDQHLDRKTSAADNPNILAARRLLPPDPLAWGYLNLELVRLAPQFKTFFAVPNDNPVFPLLLGGYLDLVRRAPFLTLGLYGRPQGFLATFRLPRGREGSAVEMAAHVPPEDQPGSRPILKPRNALFSTSYFFDLSKIWEHRATLLNAQQREFLDAIEKQAGKQQKQAFDTGIKQLLSQIGTYQRIVVAAQGQPEYSKEPAQRLPAGAFVLELRDPKSFRQVIEVQLRTAALFLTTQFRLQLKEEKIGEHLLVGYRFDEKAALTGDVNNLRFNFSPCFAIVGNQFVICSSMELGREMVALLDREAKGGLEATGRPGNTASGRTLLSAAGGAVFLQAIQEQLFVQAMLERALTPEAAKQQVQTFIDVLRKAGTLELEATYGAREFRYDFEIKLGR